MQTDLSRHLARKDSKCSNGMSGKKTKHIHMIEVQTLDISVHLGILPNSYFSYDLIK